MNLCHLSEQILDRRLPDNRRFQFEEHLRDCPGCCEDMRIWGDIQPVLRQAAEQYRMPDPTEDMVEQLVQRASSDVPMKRSGHKQKVIYWLVAASLLIIGSAVLFLHRIHQSAPDQTDKPGLENLAKSIESTGGSGASTVAVSEIVAPQTIPQSTQQSNRLKTESVISLGNDRIRLSADARALVAAHQGTEIVIELAEGEIIVLASPRKNNGQFMVQAGRYQVRVVGTLFVVKYDPGNRMEVTVVEGTVEVLGAAELPVRVTAHQRLHISKTNHYLELMDTHRSELRRVNRLMGREKNSRLGINPKRSDGGVRQAGEKRAGPGEDMSLQPAMDRWRKMVLSGELATAEDQMTGYLSRHPDDWRVWSLLADCRRKAKKWQGAVRAYTEVTELGTGATADRARFLLGVVLQDRLEDHPSAVKWFRDYLKACSSGKKLVASAKIRLSKSMIALGDKSQAEAILTEIAEHSEDSTLRLRAQGLLNNL
ncbi:MAG: hypothetical protein GY847_33595 [Proteobacteria bacterium]|nr:hypothetical protein [Pseudomonadota bacterium]